MARRKTIVPAGRVLDYTDGKPELFLIKPCRTLGDVELIRFASRAALEAFNRKAGLKPLVYTETVPNMAIWAHERERR